MDGLRSLLFYLHKNKTFGKRLYFCAIKVMIHIISFLTRDSVRYIFAFETKIFIYLEIHFNYFFI